MIVYVHIIYYTYVPTREINIDMRYILHINMRYMDICIIEL